eukprot:Phypoly_transcript_08064.p1 GENE.Phypoly_transcript_08064~~Phypoly_transcript_08064.p1  ORF type:complete len:296 (+),score=32.24 Phypoly_transcript_08064:35-889(+)
MDKELIPSCPVCIDGFDDPRILQCGHSICHQCATKIPLQKGLVICPLCKQSNPCSSVHNIPKNYSLLDIIEKLQAENKTKCSNHPTQILDMICSKCDEVPVCAKCLLEGSHKGHTYMGMQEYEIIVNKRMRKANLCARFNEITESFNILQDHFLKLQLQIEECTPTMELQKETLVKMVEAKLGCIRETDLNGYEDTLQIVEVALEKFVQQHKIALDQLCANFPPISSENENFAKIMAPPGVPQAPPYACVVRATSEIIVQNYSHLPEKHYTPPFVMCNLKWYEN